MAVGTSEDMYKNLNQCRTFNIDTTFPDQICGEVIVINRSGAAVTINDKGNVGTEFGFVLEDTESFAFRGVTNSNELSATAGALTIRTQYFSNSPSR